MIVLFYRLRVGLYLLVFLTMFLASCSETELIDDSYKMVWEKCYGGTYSDDLGDIISTADGGFILVGYTDSKDGDVQSAGEGCCFAWVAKLDADMQIQWENSFGGIGWDGDSFSSVVELTKGGYVIAGIANSNDGDIQSGNNGLADYWIVKINESGELIWEHTYGGSDYDFATRIVKTVDGGFVVGGVTRSNDRDIQSGLKGGDDIWMLKLDPNGTLIWERAYGGLWDEAFLDVQLTDDGGLIFTGYSYSKSFDVKSGNYGVRDVWVVKTDATGTIEWEKNLGGTGADSGGYIVVSDDSYHVFGYTFSDDMDVQSGNAGTRDAWYVRLDFTGEILFEQTYGEADWETFTYCLPISNDGFVCGGYELSGPNNDPFISAFLMNINNEGKGSRWTALGGSGHEFLRKIIQLPTGNLLLALSTTSADGDISQALGEPGYTDIWLVEVQK